MSADGDGSGEDSGPGNREVAYRLFAAEFDDADLDHSESDEERAPNYVVTPTGARVNRLFVVGVLTEVEQVGDDVLRARVADPTGAFVVYAGQYQPDAMAFLEDVSTPSFVAVTGKARTFEPDDADRIYTSVRPESVSAVDAEARDRWVVRTAEHTLDRVATMADALDRPERGADLRTALAADGVPEGLAAGAPLALDHYDTTGSYLAAVRDLALDAVRVVTGDRDEAGTLSLAPDEGGPTDRDLSFAGVGTAAGAAAGAEAGATPDETSETARADAGAASADDETAGTTATGETVEADADESATDADATETTVDADADDGTEEAADGDGAGNERATAAADGDAPVDSAEGASNGADEDADDAASVDGADAGEEFELDEDEREAVMEEHGVEFSSGTEIPDAGEAGIETPDAEAADDASDDADGETGDDAADETDADLEDTVVEYMTELNDGEGVARDDLKAAVVEDHDVSADAVADAVQDALMAGRCYESGDDELTPI